MILMAELYRYLYLYSQSFLNIDIIYKISKILCYIFGGNMLYVHDIYMLCTLCVRVCYNL